MDKILVCKKCGAMVKVIVECTCENCGIKCCGEQMVEQEFVSPPRCANGCNLQGWKHTSSWDSQ